MNGTQSNSMGLPPRLTMDEYMDFIESSSADSSSVLTEQQKRIEKRILKPFRLSLSSDLKNPITPSEGAE